jgi:hypothetical protein
MKRNAFGEPIFEAGDEDAVLDQSGLDAEEVLARIDYMDSDDKAAGYCIEFTNAEDCDTFGYWHDIPTAAEARAICDRIGVQYEDDNVRGDA